MRARRPHHLSAAFAVALLLAFTGLAANPPAVAASWTASITVLFNNGDGEGRVTSEDGGIDCVFADSRSTGDCEQSYTYADFLANASVSMQYIPATGSYVCDAARTGCVTSGSSVGFNVDFARGTSNDAYLFPKFLLKTYQVMVDIDGPGVISSSGGASCTPSSGHDYCRAFKHGATATLVATPESGYPFSWWLGSPCEQTAGKEATCTFTATGDKDLTATFGYVYVTIHRSTGGFVCQLGSQFCLQPGQSTLRVARMVGTTQFFDAIPDTGYAFDHWNAGPCAGKGAQCTFTLQSAADLSATFRKLATPAPSAKPTAAPSARPTTRPEATNGPAPSQATATPAPGATTAAGTVVPSTDGPATSPDPYATMDAAASSQPGGSAAGPDALESPAASAIPQPVDAPTGGGGLDPLVLALLAIVAVMTVVIGFLFGRLRRNPRAGDGVAS